MNKYKTEALANRFGAPPKKSRFLIENCFFGVVFFWGFLGKHHQISRFFEVENLVENMFCSFCLRDCVAGVVMNQPMKPARCANRSSPIDIYIYTQHIYIYTYNIYIKCTSFINLREV